MSRTARLFVLTGLLGAANGIATAQTPDVAPFVDARAVWHVSSGDVSGIRFYDLRGRHSLVGIRMQFEPGLRGKVSQRLQRIQSDNDEGLLDEVYVEDRGTWRLGKQVLPFGTRSMVREAVLAARVNTVLIIDDAPIALAYADGGDRMPRGVVARAGRDLGFSGFLGEHFGSSASSLTSFRRPTEAPGKGTGYRVAVGLDWSTRWRGTLVSFEWVSLRDGHTAVDTDLDLSELRGRFFLPSNGWTIDAVWARAWGQQENYFAAEFEIPTGANLTWMPYVRFEDLQWRDFGLAVRVKL